MKLPHQKTSALLIEMGIDPSRVMIDNFDESGYSLAILRGDNSKVVDPRIGHVKTTRHSWSSIEVAQRVMAVFRSEHRVQS